MVGPVDATDGRRTGGERPTRGPDASAAGRRRSLAGDRMLIAVALVIVAAVAAMGAFALVAAERIDTTTQKRWNQLVTRSLERQTVSLGRDLATFARWDESLIRTAYLPDIAWVHRNFGRWLHDSLSHDRSYVVLGERIGYASIDGEMIEPERAVFDRGAILPLVRQVQLAYAATAGEPASRAAAGERPSAAPVFRAQYARIEGRPALVGVINITPDLGNVLSPSREPPVAVTALFLDDDFLAELVAEFRVAEPLVSDVLPSDARFAVPIPFTDATTPPAWLTWMPERPGRHLLRALLPALIGTAGLLLAAAAIVLWYARRATRELSESEALASKLAYVDPLSGLANRAMLMRVMDGRLPRVTLRERLAVLFIDLDGFKDINDTLGHHVGDRLLAEIGRRLHRCAGPDGLAARFGGDEFVMVVPVGPGDGPIADLGGAVLEAIRQPALVEGQSLTVAGSIGATVAPDHGRVAGELIRRADIAVYRAKADGRGTFRMFEHALEAEVQQRRSIEVELSGAIERDELEVFYQPQLEADGETIIGLEAVVRWPRPDGGLVAPGAFIPVAEQTGLITALDLWVLRRACRQARDWGVGKLAVNLSPVDFRSRDLVASIAAILGETGFDPRRLEIEITENLLFGNQPEAFASLSALRAMGVRIALDDFGSGYSSLGYIRRFRVDTIKIDKSFTQNIGLTDDAAAVIECVVRLGRALGITVTAEGVETREQLRYLQMVGCDHVQGFLFAPPLPVGKIEPFLARSSRRFGGAAPPARTRLQRSGGYTG